MMSVLSVTVRSPCLSGVRVLGFLRGVVPKKEVGHVRRHVICRGSSGHVIDHVTSLGSSEDYTSRRDLESSEIQHVISKTFRGEGE